MLVSALDNIKYLVGGTGLLTLLYYFVQVAANRASFKSSKQKLTIDFLNEWRDPEFTKSRHYINDSISKRVFSQNNDFIEKGYRFLEKEDKEHILKVSFFCDYIGSLVAAKALDNKLLFTMIGNPIIRYWKIMSPLLNKEREYKNKDNEDFEINKNKKNYDELYQSGFEHLFVEASKFSQRSSLKLKRVK